MPAVSIFLILFLYYFYLFFKIIIIFLTLEVGKKKTLFFSFFNWHSCWRVHQFTNRLHYSSRICFPLFWVVGISCFFEARFRCLSLCRRRLVTHLIVFYVAFALFLLLSGPLFFFLSPSQASKLDRFVTRVLFHIWMFSCDCASTWTKEIWQWNVDLYAYASPLMVAKSSTFSALLRVR